MFSLATTEWHALEAVKLFLQLALQIDVLFCFVLIMLSTWNCWIDHVHTCTKGIHGQVSINSLDQYLINSRSRLNQYMIISLTVGWESTDLYNILLCISWKLVDCQLTIEWCVSGVSFECQLRCWQSVNKVLIGCWSKVNRSRILIDTWLQMPLVLLIYVEIRFWQIFIPFIFQQCFAIPTL